MALLITLTVTTLLIITALELNRRMRSAVMISASGRDQVTMLSMASSGIHMAMAFLVHDKQNTPIDSANEDWANHVKTAAIMDTMEFENGHVTVEISDELSRIQVNALVEGPDGQNFNMLQQQLLYRFLDLQIPPENRDDHTTPQAIINSIKDWIDYGDGDAVTGLSGAESDYYRSLDPPYSSANSFLTDLTDLMRIKGITENLYFGTFEKPGLSRYLTVFGEFEDGGEKMIYPGKININTAEAPVLAALFPPEYKDMIDMLIDFRTEQAGGPFIHNLSDATWYRRVPGFSMAHIDPGLITTSSDIFRIKAGALLNEKHLKLTAVVHRQKAPETGKIWCNVLSWQIK